ncbi:MAG: hypothetical protein ACOH16_06530 [Propionibacteriaceae bacterium]
MSLLVPWVRQQWGAVIVLLASVIVAGFLLRVDYGDEFGATYRTQVGVTAQLNDSTRVLVTGLRFAGRIQEGSRITSATSEVFLVIDYTVAVDDVPYGTVTAKLTSGQMTYSSITSALAVPAPGFQRRRHLVFEVSLADLPGAGITMVAARDLRQFERIVVVDLGLTPQKVAELTAERYQTAELADGDDEVQR